MKLVQAAAIAAALLLMGTMVLAGEKPVSPQPAPNGQPIVVQGFTPKPNPAALIAQTCCKICRKGKACGNSCIARSKTCRKPPGCACDG